jgi:hypothetical protein
MENEKAEMKLELRAMKAAQAGHEEPPDGYDRLLFVHLRKLAAADEVLFQARIDQQQADIRQQQADIRQQQARIDQQESTFFGEHRRTSLESRFEGILRMVAEALTPDPWSNLSQTKRPDSFIDKIKDSWTFNAYPAFCCVLQSVYGAECSRFGKSCETWTVGAHIIPHSFDIQRLRHILRWQPGAVDSPCNGLPLCKELEEAFDKSQWCLNYDEMRLGWILLVLDPELRGTTISLTHRQSRKRTKFQPRGLTWDFLDGKEVRLADDVSRSALVYHAYCASKRFALPPGVRLNILGDRKRKNSPPTGVHDWLRGIQPPCDDDPQ